MAYWRNWNVQQVCELHSISSGYDIKVLLHTWTKAKTIMCVRCGIKMMNYCKETLKKTQISSPSRISKYGNISLFFHKFVHSLRICIWCLKFQPKQKIGIDIAFKLFVMSQINLVVPPLKVQFSNSQALNWCFQQWMLFVSDSAHPSLYTVKVKHSTGGTRRETGFWLERVFKHFIFQVWRQTL